jgi:hypothetical protein
MKTPRVQDFDPSANIPELGSPMDTFPSIQKPNARQEQTTPLPERPNVPTPHRPNVRRIITRNSFEIYEDQMDDLRREAYEEKLAGGTGSMSKMVRDAIDTYLEKRRAEK